MSQNPDIMAALTALREAYDGILAAKEETEDPQVYAQLNDKLVAVQQRIARLEGLVFAQRSQALAEAAAGVEAAQGELADALKNVENLTHVVQTATALVGTIDKVISAAASVGLG